MSDNSGSIFAAEIKGAFKAFIDWLERWSKASQEFGRRSTFAEQQARRERDEKRRADHAADLRAAFPDALLRWNQIDRRADELGIEFDPHLTAEQRAAAVAHFEDVAAPDLLEPEELFGIRPAGPLTSDNYRRVDAHIRAKRLDSVERLLRQDHGADYAIAWRANQMEHTAAEPALIMSAIRTAIAAQADYSKHLAELDAADGGHRVADAVARREKDDAALYSRNPHVARQQRTNADAQLRDLRRRADAYVAEHGEPYLAGTFDPSRGTLMHIRHRRGGSAPGRT